MLVHKVLRKPTGWVAMCSSLGVVARHLRRPATQCSYRPVRMTVWRPLSCSSMTCPSPAGVEAVRSSSGRVGPSPFEGARRRLPGQADLGPIPQAPQGLAGEPLVQARLGVSTTFAETASPLCKLRCC